MRIASIVLIALLSIAGFANAGEMGDHCVTGLSNGQIMKTDCSVKTEYRGKTYCFSNEDAKKTFMADPDNIVAKANAFYEKNAERRKITQEEASSIIKSQNCDLSDKDVGYLDFKGMDLHHCTMVNTSFFGADLRGTNFTGANMQRSYLNLARLETTNLSGANLSNAIIFSAILDSTNFSGANLTNARMMGNLGNVNMTNANVKQGRLGMDFGNQTMGQVKFDTVGGKFANADLSDADLQVASFRFGDLRSANLRNANLYRADLIQADLTGADLTGANLTDAEVEGAILKDVKGLNTIKGMGTVKGKFRP